MNEAQAPRAGQSRDTPSKAQTFGNFGNAANFGNAPEVPFVYRRRVQFAETDLAGIVHFSWMMRYMEEAEHAWWRAAGLSVAEPGGEIGWPRVAASVEFRSPLHFEDVVEVRVRLAAVTRRTLKYEHTVVRDATVIGTGSMTVVCVRKGEGSAMRASELPVHLVRRLKEATEGQAPRDVPP